MAVDVFRNVHAKATTPIWGLAREVHRITRADASTIWIGSGWRPGSTEHASGRALDIIVADKAGTMPTAAERANGERVVAWLIAIADALHIRHIIWNRRIWKRRYRGTPTAWTALTGRSGIADWHQDHIHVYLDNTTGRIPNIPLPRVGVAAPGVPSAPAPTPTGGLTVNDVNTIMARLDDPNRGLPYLSRQIKATDQRAYDERKYMREQLVAIAEGAFGRKAINARNKDTAVIVERALNAFAKRLPGVDSAAVAADVKMAVSEALSERDAVDADANIQDLVDRLESTLGKD